MSTRTGKFAEQLVLSVVEYAFRAFWLMIAVGIAHRHWLPKMPTIGYWTSLLVVVLLTGIFTPIRHDKDKS